MPWFRELQRRGPLLGRADRPGRYPGLRRLVPRRRDDTDEPSAAPQLAAAVFGAAPRALAGVITLQQTVDLVRLSIEVVESNIDEHPRPGRRSPTVHAAVLRYAREVAFATAEVYARAAEVRGAWDARLEALVVDAVLRAETDEAVLSRASALGWRRAATWPWCSAQRPPSAPRPTSSTRYAAWPGPRAWTPCAPRRATAWWSPGWRDDEPQGGRAPSWTSSATVRSWSARSPRTWPGPHLGPRRAVRAPLRAAAGRTPRDRCAATTCCPSGRWPATATPAGTWSTTSTSRCCAPGAR